MKKTAIALSFMIAALTGCSSQGPISVDGTLPIVTGLVLREDACRGDTLVFMWDSVAVEIDDFGLWFSHNPGFIWMKAGDFPGTVGVHVADRIYTYSVWAQKGTQHSSALSNRVGLATQWLGQASTPAEHGIPGFAVSPDTIRGGDATNPGFHQDFFLRMGFGGYMVYAGHADPRMCPGGRFSRLAPVRGDGFRAPHPESPEWTDSLPLMSAPAFFIMLEDQHYGRFTTLVYQSPDTLQPGLVAETGFLYQPVQRVRLFD